MSVHFASERVMRIGAQCAMCGHDVVRGSTYIHVSHGRNGHEAMHVACYEAFGATARPTDLPSPDQHHIHCELIERLVDLDEILLGEEVLALPANVSWMSRRDHWEAAFDRYFATACFERYPDGSEQVVVCLYTNGIHAFVGRPGVSSLVAVQYARTERALLAGVIVSSLAPERRPSEVSGV